MTRKLQTLAALAITILAASSFAAHAQNSAPAGDYPKSDLFLGYSYVRAVPSLADGNRIVTLNGGSAALAYNFTKNFGLVTDFGGFTDSQLRLSGPGANPTEIVNSGGSVYTFLFGPRFSYRNNSRFTPFGQVLAGGAYASEVTISGCTTAPCTPLPEQGSFAMTAGGGLDIRVNRHLSIRAAQAEYLMTRFEDLTAGSRSAQNDVRLSGGLVFMFGAQAGIRPVGYACAVIPAAVYPGETVTIVGTASDLDGSHTPTYTWTATGGIVTGKTTTATVNTANLTPGTYVVSGHVAEGTRSGMAADCTAAYTVRETEPPTVGCSVTPAMVAPGSTARVVASSTGGQDSPLTYSFTASDGSISGTSSTAILNTTGASPGPITVTATVADLHGRHASGDCVVTVEAPAPPKVDRAKKLCSIHFDRDIKRPTRVDNEAKACLDEVALIAQQDSGATIILVGAVAAGEKQDDRAAQQRSVNAKFYLVTEKGVDYTRVEVRTAPGDSKQVDTYLLPAGASMDATYPGTTAFGAPVR